MSTRHELAPAPTEAPPVRVWDLVVRFGHWSLAALFLTAYLTEGKPMWLHSSAGYGVLIVIAFRVLWGFIGTTHARFRDFAYPPREVIVYLKSLLARHPRHYLGHNPAGGAMVFALLLSLCCTAGSGMGLYAAENGRGPVAAAAALLRGEGLSPSGKYRRIGGEDFWEESHEFLANATLCLVLLHVGGVLASSLAHRENLIRAMLTGRKRGVAAPLPGSGGL